MYVLGIYHDTWGEVRGGHRCPRYLFTPHSGRRLLFAAIRDSNYLQVVKQSI